MEKHVGFKIKQLRKEKKDTLKELAQKVDYDWSNLSKVERGVYGASIELLKKIAEVYEVSPNYFFSEGFTGTEGSLIIEDNLDPSELRKKYRFVSKDGEGVEATDEEIIEALKLIRLLRPKTHDD
jgi:transcriptional regulator with XRE-family HTH domain